MKFLIAGYGSIGRRHFRNLLSLGENDILFYRTNKSVLADNELEGYPVLTNLEEALSYNPDAVIISNPTALHLDVAIPAAQAGCDILLEKPVSHNMERIDQLKKTVDQSGSRVLVGFQFRFHPGLNKIKRIISDGEIGRPLSVRAHWGEYLPDWHPWEDYRKGYSARADLGGGVLLTLSHPFDYLSWLLGNVEELWALLGNSSDLEINRVEDSAEIGLKFENGVIGSLHLNYYQRPLTHRLEIIFTEGTLYWDYQSGDVKVYHYLEDCWKEYPQPVDFTRNQLYLNEMNHFIKVISNDLDPICSLEDGIRIQLWIEGSKISAKTGKRYGF